MRILYIEDDPNDANLITRYMQATQHELVLVSDANEARSLDAQQFDLIMVDVVLNHTRDGYKLAQELREHGYQQPVIAVTGLSLPKEIEACYDAGFSFVLTKPFEIPQLVNVIETYGK